MSTITRELAKLFRKITNSEIDAEGNAHVVLSPADSLLINNARIALASLEAEPGVNHQPVAWQYKEYVYVSGLGYLWREKLDCEFPGAECETLKDVVPLYKAPPAPVSVPDAIHSQGEKSASDDYYALGWNACRAAMLKHSEPFIVTSDHRMMEMPQVEAINAVTAILQGADGTLTNEGTIPVTQFKPVADLYGLTSPTGGETSFTFDAVEARDFIDGGWLCQEYVTLERYQEAITNHTEDKLAMVDHSGDSNNMVEPVTTAYKLQDGWVACSERMPEIGIKVLCFPVNDEPIHATYNGQVWLQDISWSASDEPIDNVISCNVFHWMPLPPAPQQEVKP